MNIAHTTGLEIGPKLRNEWDELAAASTNPSVFTTYDFIANSWRTFESTNSTFHLLTARWNETLVGLLPLKLTRHRADGDYNSVLTYAGAAANDQPYLLARPQHEAASWDAFLDTIKPMEWDRLSLHHIPSVSPGRFALTLHFGARTQTSVESESGHYWAKINLSRPPHNPVAIIDSSTESHVPELLTADFCNRYPNLAIDEYLTAESIEDGIDIFVDMVQHNHSNNNWSFLDTPSPCSDSVCETYFRHMMIDLCSKGRTGIRVMRSGKNLLAANITHTFNDVACLYNTVSADEHREYMPSEVLNTLVIERLRDQSPSMATSTVSNARQWKRWSCGTTAAETVTVTRASKPIENHEPRHELLRQ